MPRQLTFRLRRREFRATPLKIDRRRLYGWTEIEATDDAGEPCSVVSTDETGLLMIPPGGTAVGLLTPRGEWAERSELKSVTTDGKPAELLPSSYSTVIALAETVTPEVYFEHDITDFYQLTEIPDDLVGAVGDRIYTFRYCYAAGCEGSPAFVLAADGKLFLLVGERRAYEMVGYDEPGFIDPDAEDEGDAETVDFAMF